jgi:hypothetical protein
MSETKYQDLNEGGTSGAVSDWLDNLDADRNDIFDANYSVVDNYRFRDPLFFVNDTYKPDGALQYTRWDAGFKTGEPTLVDASSTFGYKGNMIQDSLNSSPSRTSLFIPVENLANSKSYVDNSTLFIRFFMRFSAAIEVTVRTYAVYDNGTTETTIRTFLNNVIVDADTNYELSNETITINKTNLEGISIAIFPTAGGAPLEDTVISISQLYVGDVLPTISYNENISDIFRDVQKQIDSKVSSEKKPVLFLTDSMFNQAASKFNVLTGRKIFDGSYGGETNVQLYNHYITELSDYYDYTSVFEILLAERLELVRQNGTMNMLIFMKH